MTLPAPRPALLAFVLGFISLPGIAQKFYYGINAGFSNITYSFPVENDLYHYSDIQPVAAIKAGASVQYALTNSFRVGTGVQYFSTSGKKDGGHLQGRTINPNGNGDIIFEVDNAFLVMPVEFTVYLTDKKVRPLLTGGLNFFKALRQDILIRIEPDDPDPAYDEFFTKLDDDAESSYFGARLGGGVAFAPLENHEVSIIVFRNFYKSRYDISNPIYGRFEKHEIAFNGWEIGLAWHLL